MLAPTFAPTPLTVDAALGVAVNGVPIYDCHYGTSNGKYAIKVEEMLTSPDQGWLGARNVT
jgi:flagellar motor switch protein FliM